MVIPSLLQGEHFVFVLPIWCFCTFLHDGWPDAYSLLHTQLGAAVFKLEADKVATLQPHFLASK